MNRTEYIGKLNALYVGDKNCLEELITTYDEKGKEIERLNNIINDLLNRQNEALRYIGNHLSLDSRYKHGNGDKELTLVRDILNKHIKELKENNQAYQEELCRLWEERDNAYRIINELEKWLEEQHQFIIEIPAYTKEISIEHKTMEICYENILDKLQELKGSDK